MAEGKSFVVFSYAYALGAEEGIATHTDAHLCTREMQSTKTRALRSVLPQQPQI